jgi:Family of unknown function (DUF5719)
MTGDHGPAPGTDDDGQRRRRGPGEPTPVPPAHRRGDRLRSPGVRRDRRSLATRLPFVLAVAAALAGAVAVDHARRDPAGEAAAAATRPATLMPASPAAEVGSSTWYCAAGTADENGMADHTVSIVNPTDDDLVATVTVFAGEVATTSTTPPPATTTTAAPGERPPETLTEQVEVPAGARVDVRPGDLVEAPLAAALVEVDGGDVAVEHRVSGTHGADVAPCSTFASPTWHFAWGATSRDAREIVVLFNPFPSSATVDAVFTTEDGRREPVRFQGFPVPAGSVVGVDLGDDVTRSEQVSATFTARSGRVVAERLQQYDGTLGTRGLSLTLGVPGAADTWVFADGEASAASPTTPAPDAEGSGEDPDGGEEPDAGDDDRGDPGDELTTAERIVVYNPGDERAQVDVSVVPTTEEPGPLPQPFRLSVGPGGYEVVDYGGQDRIVAGVPHATVVRSTDGHPVVAERVTVDAGPAPTAQGRRATSSPPARQGEITASAGSRLAAPVWRFPSMGDPAAPDGTVELVVFNPDPEHPVRVGVDLFAGTSRDAADEGDPADGGDIGAVEPPPIVVAPGARVALVLDEVQAAAALAAAVDADGPVVVDRVVRWPDGRRLSLAAGIPGARDAVTLDALADGGVLAGTVAG